MQFLIIAALLVSAAAARPDSWRPWQDENFPPAGGPKLDADPNCGDREHSVTGSPEDGDAGSGDWTEGDSGHPVWPHDLPPWLQNRPSARPGNGNPQGPLQAPGFGLGPSRHFGRPRVPRRGRGPNMRNPGVTGNIVFSPVFKVDNVTFQNISGVLLKEGESVFVMPKHCGRGPHHHRGGRHGPPENVQYVKLIYNATELNKVSIEYGVVKPMNLGALVGIQDDPEEADW